MSFSCEVRRAVCSSSYNFPSAFVCSFRIRAVHGTAMRAKLGTNVWKTLHNPMTERISICADGVFKSRISSVVCLATFKSPGGII